MTLDNIARGIGYGMMLVWMIIGIIEWINGGRRP